MKLLVPLSLKVSLWLLLNLLLLAAGALVYSVSRGPARWDSLVTGRAGERLQALGGLIASDTSDAPGGERGAVLRRFSAAYGADFYLFSNRGGEIAGDPVTLPAEVSRRLAERRPPPPETDGGEPGRPPPGDRPEGLPRGRFLLATGWPAHLWLGIRVPYEDPDTGERRAATLVARTHSLLGVAKLLDWYPWIAAAAVVLVFSILFWLPFVGSLTAAVRKLAKATERIAEGDFKTRVQLERRDELGRLGGSVNRMAGRLDTLVNGQRRFLGDAAHELCSPLGRLQMATGILEERAEPALAPVVADLREEVQQMAALVDELLEFSKAGVRGKSTPIEDVALAPLIRRVIARESAGMRTALSLDEELHAAAAPDLLSRALGNLVRNALRYGGDGAVMVSAGRTGAGVEIAVRDAGPGVPPEALARLGEPFFRPESARTRETGGTGLGLAIVRSCTESCGGTVAFRNLEPRGFEAKMILHAPAAAAGNTPWPPVAL